MPLRWRGIANMTVPPQGPPLGWPPQQGPPYPMPQYGYPQWGPSDRCPFISLLDCESPKIYGSADKAAVEATLSEFAGA